MGVIQQQAATGQLSAAIFQELRTEIYANRMLISPRRLREIAHAEETEFAKYQQSLDIDAVRAHGRALAVEGLGHRAVLGLISALRQSSASFNDSPESWRETTAQLDDYIKALLEGYMAGREDDLKLEQQRTHEAYVRSLSR